MRGRRVLLLGLDGADESVLAPLCASGRLPSLAAMRGEATVAPLPSVTPPMSFPAWSSFATGLSPGEHGLFDFTQKLEGAYRIRFVNASDRTGEPFWMRASRAGHCVLCLGVPATYPPDRVDGLLVPGFDAPVSTGSSAAFASDPALYARIAARAGDWMRPDLDESAAGDWHERAVAQLLARVDRKLGFALEALRMLREDGRDPALAIVVFSESDTVAHHYWRDHDPASPRHDPTASALRKDALAAVYERLDAAVGALRSAFGDAACAIVSDHGQGGASRRVLHPNRRLAECGLLVRKRRGALDGAARSARDLALRLLPSRAAQAIFRLARSSAARLESAARFGGVDWSKTAAFSEEVNTQPGVWLNVAGREAAGSVAARDVERVRRDVIDALLDWKLAGGARAVAWAAPREEIYRGPFLARAPDVVFELALEAGYAHSIVATPWERGDVGAARTLEAHELAGGRGRGMNGTHRRDGVWIASGGDASWRRAAPASIEAVAARVLEALGIDADSQGGEARAPLPYSAEEEARVAARLRALGYLE